MQNNLKAKQCLKCSNGQFNHLLLICYSLLTDTKTDLTVVLVHRPMKSSTATSSNKCIFLLDTNIFSCINTHQYFSSYFLWENIFHQCLGSYDTTKYQRHLFRKLYELFISKKSCVLWEIICKSG